MSKQPHLEEVSLKLMTVALKPPFKATTEEIRCPLPMIRKFNPVRVHDYCHGWAMKNELCRYASDCGAYLDLLIHRVHDGEPVESKVMAQLGLDVDILKKARKP